MAQQSDCELRLQHRARHPALGECGARRCTAPTPVRDQSDPARISHVWGKQHDARLGEEQPRRRRHARRRRAHGVPQHARAQRTPEPCQCHCARAPDDAVAGVCRAMRCASLAPMPAGCMRRLCCLCVVVTTRGTSKADASVHTTNVFTRAVVCPPLASHIARVAQCTAVRPIPCASDASLLAGCIATRCMLHRRPLYVASRCFASCIASWHRPRAAVPQCSVV